jgi:hypothetical protein
LRSRRAPSTQLGSNHYEVEYFGAASRGLAASGAGLAVGTLAGNQ